MPSDTDTPAAPIRVLVLGSTPGFLDAVRAALEGEEGVQHALHQGGIEELGRPGVVDAPDVLIVQEDHKDPDHFRILAQYTQRHPDVAVVLSTQQKDPDMMVQALRAGVKEFLFEPFAEGEIAAVVKRLGRGKGAAPPARHAEVMAFIPCKGGSGATFLASNLAHLLAARHKKKVLLMDLNLQFGDAAFFLMDRSPPSTLADVCGSFARLDRAFLESSVAKMPSGLHILAAPERPGDAELVKPEHIESIMSLARSEYDFVVLDVGRTLDVVALKALDLADYVYPVLQLSLPYIRDAKRMKETFNSLGYSETKVRWVINRAGGEGDISVDEVSRVIGHPFWSVPNDHKHVGDAVNQGIPVTQLAPHSPSAKSLVHWTEALVTEQVESKPRKHWFPFFRD